MLILRCLLLLQKIRQSTPYLQSSAPRAAFPIGISAPLSHSVQRALLRHVVGRSTIRCRFPMVLADLLVVSHLLVVCFSYFSV
jgi:hypothetical protein